MNLFKWKSKELDGLEKKINTPIVTLTTEEETLDPDLDLIQTDPYPLYINKKTNDMCISYDNKKTISTINLNGQSYDIQVPSLDAEIKKIWERLNTQVSLVHNCANCGATLELEENKAIIHCKYCGSTYIVGPARLNSHY